MNLGYDMQDDHLVVNPILDYDPVDPRELKQEYHLFYNHELHVENGDFLVVDCYLCFQDTCLNCKGKIYIYPDGVTECPFCVNGRVF